MFILDVDVVGCEGVGGVLLILNTSPLCISGVPGPCRVFGVISGVRRRSIASWVCCLLGTPYVPRRGAWVLNCGCWGATNVKLPRATAVKPLGIVSGQELLPTRVVLIGGGIPNRDHLPVKGTGGGHCANGCQVRAYCWSLSLEAGDDIVCREWGEVEIGLRDSPSSEKSQSL